MNFIDKWNRGDDVDIDDFIDEWHQSLTTEPIHEYLGLSLDEYMTWCEHNKLPERKINVRVE